MNAVLLLALWSVATVDAPLPACENLVCPLGGTCELIVPVTAVVELEGCHEAAAGRHEREGGRLSGIVDRIKTFFGKLRPHKGERERGKIINFFRRRGK